MGREVRQLPLQLHPFGLGGRRIDFLGQPRGLGHHDHALLQNLGEAPREDQALGLSVRAIAHDAHFEQREQRSVPRQHADLAVVCRQDELHRIGLDDLALARDHREEKAGR